MPSKAVKILFVDDDPVTCSVMRRNCTGAGYDCRTFLSARECFDAFVREGADVIVTDLRMPQMNGFELLSGIRAVDNEVPVIVITGYSSVENAVEAMKRGATDFIKKPFDFSELRLLIERTLQSLHLRMENTLLKKRLRPDDALFGMIGDSAAMKKLFNTIDKVAEVSCNVIITGESGAGKELVAQALHGHSPRRDRPFVVVDCGALTETLLESELFGHEKGAFTGAIQRKRGLMEQAHGGTLFLDEIGNISDAMQIKLMRAIEEQKISRVGGSVPIEIDLRIIAASNRDLETLVREGKFRHDFYHRLNVVSIRVPSLAERREDIPALVEHFVRVYAQRYHRHVQGFDPESMRRLCQAPWPGNVRELRNVVERCIILAEEPVLTWPAAQTLEAAPDIPAHASVFSDTHLPSLDQIEQEYIQHVLTHCGGKKNHAAQILGIDKTTLWRKLRRHEN